MAQNGVDIEFAKNTGNIARQTLTIPGTSFVQSYRYDSLYRLKEAVEKTGANQNWIQNWEYDPYGNRTVFTQNIGGNTSAWNPGVVAASNRFGENQGFTYDKNGNVVHDIDPLTSHNRLFTFNGDNKQIAVKDTSTNITKGQYFYDGEGKRVKKVNPETGETTVFVYSSGKLVAEYSTATPPASPSINYTTTDHLGSPRIITDVIGQVKSRRDFLPFGEEVTPNVGNRSASPGYSATDNIRQKFTGYQKDTETSLDFAEARMYENRFGRFTAVDPLLASGKSAEPQSFNRYAYVVNNPLVMTDPSGQCPVGECPTSYYGTVYYKDIDGKRWYNNENDGSWEVYKGDTLFWRNDNKGYARINEFGWYTMNASEALAYLGEQGNSYTATFAGFGRDLNFSDQFRLTFTAMGKSGGNVVADFDNLFYRTAEKLSLFAPVKLPTVERWEPVNAFEAQQMRATDIALAGISIYSGGLASSARTGPLSARAAASSEGTSLPIQTHHFATIRNQTYTPQMSKIADEFGLSLKGSWNTQQLPHLGRHPNAYHDFVLRGMQNARAGANGSQTDFLRLFDLNVRQPVIRNPQLLRKSGW